MRVKKLLILLTAILFLACAEKVPFNIQYGFNKDAVIKDIAEGKSNFQITQDDLDIIFSLYNSSDSTERKASLYLLNSAPNNSFHSFILLAIADPHPEVQETAFSLLRKNRNLTEVLISKAEDEQDIRMLISSSVFYTMDGNRRKMHEVIQYYSLKSPALNSFVSSYLYSFYPSQERTILEYLENEDPGIRGGICSFIKKTRDPEKIPLLLEKLRDSESYVQQQALDSLISFKDLSYPLINEQLGSFTDDEILPILYLFEAVESVKCIESTVQLLLSDNYEIRNRSRALILLYDEQSVPYLINKMQTGNEEEIINILKLVSLLNENESIPSIVSLLESPSQRLRNEARRTLLKKGEVSLPYLRQGVLSGSQELRQQCLEILIRAKDEELIMDKETGLINPETTLLLIYQTSDQGLRDYLSSITINNQMKDEVLILKKLIEITQRIDRLRSSNRGNPFFQDYLRWKDLQYQQFLIEKDLRQLKRDFLLTQSTEIMDEINQLDIISETKLQEIAALVLKLNDYPNRNYQRTIVNNLEALNDELLSNWNTLTFYTIELGKRIILNQNISQKYIETLEQQRIMGNRSPFQ